MRKLIKKYQAGNLFAMDKSSGYPNTGNVGASEGILSILGNLTSAAKSVIGGPAVSTAVDNILPKGGGSPISLGDVSGFNKGNFLSGIGGWGGVGAVSDVLGSLIPKQPLGALTEGLNSAYDAASNAVAAIPGFGTAASGIMKVGGLLSDGLTALGVGTDGLTTTDQILDSKFMKLTPMGLVNAFGASQLASLRNDQAVVDTLAATDGGYQSFMDKWEDALKYSGKKVGLLSGKKSLNNKIYQANQRMAVLQGIVDRKKLDDLLTALMEDRWNQATMNDLNGGFGNISFGRLGLKVEILPKVHAILNTPKVVDTLTEYEEVQEFKEGGKMNVIPEGALHARLHHMENADGLTKKGIPVVSIAEGGEMEQLAEIELNEIIFNLDVTTELEKLMKDDSDNAAIEAGKLLVKEIFENTDDRTGLIKLLEPDKKESTTEDIVKNHQVFLEGGILDLNVYLKLIKEWPALASIKFNIVADPTFTKENTGVGSIEYFSPLEEEYMVYPNGYKYKNPHIGEASIVYNPNDNDYEDIKMDLLHALRALDPKYKALVEELDNTVLKGDDDLRRTAYERYVNDRRLYGREYAPFINYVQNEVDGLLRNLFYNGDEKTLAAKNYYPNKKELIEWNKHLLPYILKIQNYLTGK